MIVEGYGRKRYKADFIKYLIYAHTERDETIVHLDFLHETGSMTDTELYKQLFTDYSTLSKRINNFIEWVEKKRNEFPTLQPET